MIDFSLIQPMIEDGLSLLKTLSGRIEPAHEVFGHSEAPGRANKHYLANRFNDVLPDQKEEENDP